MDLVPRGRPRYKRVAAVFVLLCLPSVYGTFRLYRALERLSWHMKTTTTNAVSYDDVMTTVESTTDDDATLPRWYDVAVPHQPNFTALAAFCTGELFCQTPPPEDDTTPTDDNDDEEDCRTLWFSGIHDGDEACTEDGTGFASLYSSALVSAQANADGALQPVLLLGRYGLDDHATELSRVGRWARDHGAIVVLWPRLSFQDDVVRGLEHVTDRHGHKQGPFLRLDIPLAVRHHGLFDLPGICPRHVLYTDADVVFRRVTRGDVRSLRDRLAASPDTVVLYGPEARMTPPMANTGVFFFDVPAFERELPHVLEYARNQDPYPLHDQNMLNGYFAQSAVLARKRGILPVYWNWKSYWHVPPGSFARVHIVHLHGPKPGKGLEAMANRDLTHLHDYPKPYHHLLKQGICCDDGRTGAWVLEAFNVARAPLEDVCDNGDTTEQNATRNLS